MMLNLKDVTLVALSSVKIDETIFALQKSCEQINFADIKLITHNLPSNLPTKIQFNEIEKIENIDQYSYHMIYSLGKYIETPYALTVQYDGFVINPSAWINEFLNYDYIGAPWPIPKDNFSYRDINKNLIRVGNGGFSLRSKKLIDLPNNINLEWKPFHGFYNEDGFITCNYRHIYEQNGCNFANIDIAKYFSHETKIPEIEGIVPFGFHGKNFYYERFKK